MSYHAFKDEDGNEYGSFEVFYDEGLGTPEGYLEPGWYWWACFPGCLPNSDPFGPFSTEEEAIKNAQEEG